MNYSPNYFSLKRIPIVSPIRFFHLEIELDFQIRAIQDRNRILIALKRSSHSRRWRRLLAAISSPNSFSLFFETRSRYNPSGSYRKIDGILVFPASISSQSAGKAACDRLREADAMSVPLF